MQACMSVEAEIRALQHVCDRPVYLWQDACRKGPAEVLRFAGGEGEMRTRIQKRINDWAQFSADQLAQQVAKEQEFHTYIRRQGRAPNGGQTHVLAQMQCAQQAVARIAGQPATQAVPARAERAFGQATGNVCAGEPLRNPGYESALEQLPRNEPTTLIRGALIGIDMQLQALRRCPVGGQIQQQIAALENQRAQALRTCRQLAARDNCEESPFR